MLFDKPIDRRATHSMKWDLMEANYGVSSDDGISMWVADMDFEAPAVVRKAISDTAEHGIFGYFADYDDYFSSICWWMKTRHNWDVEAGDIFSTHGLVNGTAMCVDTFTNPGDRIILFTPVYHAFARVIAASQREVLELPLATVDNQYRFDFDAYESAMRGDEKMLILCSPHNPGGRVWSRSELEEVAAFALRHDLIIVSDEIHHDLLFSGAKHIPMAHIDGIQDRLVMMTSSSKTFNIAGGYLGNVIIKDSTLKQAFAHRMQAMGMSSNSFGIIMTTAAYSSDGAAWLDELIAYIDENRKIFDAGVNDIPGLRSMELQATYLAWVDFSGTGMGMQEIKDRVAKEAKIAANAGPTFGTGGEGFLRFNFATQRHNVENAVERLRGAFKDLQ